MRCGRGADALGFDDADMGFADAIGDDLFRAAACSTRLYSTAVGNELGGAAVDIVKSTDSSRPLRYWLIAAVVNVTRAHRCRRPSLYCPAMSHITACSRTTVTRLTQGKPNGLLVSRSYRAQEY